MASLENTDEEEYNEPKYDSVRLGVALGVVSPLVTLMVYYLIYYRQMHLSSFFEYLNSGNIFIPVLSLCVVTNLLVFFIFIWTKRDKSARGVLTATVIYAAYVAVMKILG
jgi:hypothetical protein